MGVVPKKLRQAFAGIFISATLQPLSLTAVIIFHSLNEDDEKNDEKMNQDEPTFWMRNSMEDFMVSRHEVASSLPLF